MNQKYRHCQFGLKGDRDGTKGRKAVSFLEFKRQEVGYRSSLTVNVYHPSRKGKNDSDSALEAQEAATATTGPEVSSSDPEARKRMEPPA